MNKLQSYIHNGIFLTLLVLLTASCNQQNDKHPDNDTLPNNTNNNLDTIIVRDTVALRDTISLRVI